MKDAIIIGGGLAGLSAAWRLQHRDIALLESGARLGGRVHSEQRGPYVLNWGGHLFSGAGTATDALLRETATTAVDVPGTLTGLAMNGKLLVSGRIETYPLRMPMTMSARLAIVRTGARLARDVLRYNRAKRDRPGDTPADRQQRLFDYQNHRSFADYLGPLPADAEALFTPTVTRSSAEPDQIAAGAGIGYFGLVWNMGKGLSRNIIGGPSVLAENVAAALGDRVRLGTEVLEVVRRRRSVVVRCRHDGEETEIEARCVVLATPAPITRRLGVDLPAEMRDALGRITYGPYVSTAFLTGETGPRPWDRAYGIAAPRRSFSVAMNMANINRGAETERRPGGSLMTFSPAGLGRRLLERDDQDIVAAHLGDLDGMLPGVADTVEEAHVERWPLGAPYSFPGRGALQHALRRPTQRIFLAGDYLGTLYTETAIQTGLTAARAAGNLVTDETQPGETTP